MNAHKIIKKNADTLARTIAVLNKIEHDIAPALDHACSNNHMTVGTRTAAMDEIRSARDGVATALTKLGYFAKLEGNGSVVAVYDSGVKGSTFHRKERK